MWPFCRASSILFRESMVGFHSTMPFSSCDRMLLSRLRNNENVIRVDWGENLCGISIQPIAVRIVADFRVSRRRLHYRTISRTSALATESAGVDLDGAISDSASVWGSAKFAMV